MIDRATAEYVLINRAGSKMSAAGMDGETINGTNLDLNDALATALLGMNITPSSMAAVSDNDISAVSDVRQFLDRAELRILESISGRLDLVDITVGPRRESLSQLATQVEKAIERLTKKIEQLYGGGLGVLDAGVIGLDFAQSAETSGDDA